MSWNPSANSRSDLPAPGMVRLSRRSTIPAFHNSAESRTQSQASGIPPVAQPSLQSMTNTPNSFMDPFPTPLTATHPHPPPPLVIQRGRDPRPVRIRPESPKPRLHRLPLPPYKARSRSPITFTFAGEPSEYFALWRGRRVRLPGPLPWPCDLIELERVEAQHWLSRLLLGTPYLGAVDEVLREPGIKRRVLDIGTGVGVWAMDVAEMFPWTEVIGCDNVPIQETQACQNVEWDIVDLEYLPYENEEFDVVHIRFSQLRVKSYSKLLKAAWRLVRPGGLLLVFDHSSPPTKSSGESPTGTQAWTDAFHKSLERAGLEPFKVDTVVHLFGNEDLVGSDMRVPIGHGEGRMGQLGKIHGINTKAFLEAARFVMVEYGGYSDAEVDVLASAYLSDTENFRMYTMYHAFSIRKRRIG